jgi:hypothetical protein
MAGRRDYETDPEYYNPKPDPIDASLRALKVAKEAAETAKAAAKEAKQAAREARHAERVASKRAAKSA